MNECIGACAKPSAQDLRAQQRRLNCFVKEYNHVRPHEALDMETPASVHKFSTRPYPEIIKAYDYNSNLKIMKVTLNVDIRWKSYHWIYLIAALKENTLVLNISEMAFGESFIATFF